MIFERDHNIHCIHRPIPGTLVFSELVQAFTSFYSTEPNWYLDFGDTYFSISGDNELFLHNVSNQQDKSFVQVVVNKQPVSTKIFDNVEFSAEFDYNDHNFSNIFFQTNTMVSSDVDFIDKREDTYKFVVPRVDNGMDVYFPDRMKGKWMVGNYEYDHPNTKFKIPFILTKFRTSFI